MANLFELAAKLTLDSSDYEKGIEAAKQAAANFSKGLTAIVTETQNADRMVNAAADSAENLGRAAENASESISETTRSADSSASKFKNFQSAIQTIISKFSEFARSNSTVQRAVETVKTKFETFRGVLDKAKSKIQEVTDKGKNLADRGLSKIQSGIEKVKSKFEPAISTFSKAKGWLEKLKDRFKKVGDEEDKTSEKTSRFGDIVKGMLTADAIKTGLGMLWSGIKRVGQVFIDIGKQAVDAYGNYEQLAGGIKKLYGDASKEVMNNAKQAYLTSGMSANQYMEQSTKFSAALINSLGGDTKEAARLTDVAMRSIADNFNTFGTDIESVQNAFQGFAKGNYMMLDNLSLGYGGTKKEMERLISDANKYAKTIGETSNLSIDSFADIVKAIELVQKKQGIYETTSKEAATTIQGSLNMTKAAWENLLVAIADEDADFDTAIDNLIESATAAGENLIPRIEQVIKGMGRAIEKLLPIALSEAPKAIARYAPEVLKSIKSLFSVIYISLQNLLTETDWNALGGKIATGINAIDWQSLFAMFVNNFSNQVIALLDLLIGFVETIDWYKLGENIINSTIAMVENIDWASVISKAFELLGAAIGGIKSLADGLAQATWDAIKAGFEATKNYFNKYIEDAGGNVIEGLFNGIIHAVSSIGSWIYSNIFKPFIDGFKNAFGIHSPSTVMAQMGKFIIDGLVNGIKDMPAKVWNFLVQTVQKAIQFGTDMKNKAIEAARTFKDNIVNGLKSLPEKMASIGGNVVKGLWNGIKNVKDWILDKIKGFGSGVLNGIKKALGIASPSKFTKQYGKFLVEGLAIGVDKNADEAVSSVEKLSSKIKNAFDSDVLSAKFGELPDLNTDISTSLTASNATMNTESNTDRLLMMILEALTQLDDGMKEKIKSAVDGMGVNWNDRELGRFVKTYA